MKFRYLLIDETGEVAGTNSTTIAASAAQESTGFINVIDTEHGCTMSDSHPFPILQQDTYSEDAVG
jgi:hypothetical protein